jgi:23S rRNA pseudouridine955/2504/2580 synthase
MVGEKLALVALMPTTGRTHQLRVHMAAIGTPILGDGKYGGKASFIDELKMASRLHLHARRIAVPHPSGKGKLDISADLPEHMAGTFKHVGLDATPDDDPFDSFSSFEG